MSAQKPEDVKQIFGDRTAAQIRAGLDAGEFESMSPAKRAKGLAWLNESDAADESELRKATRDAADAAIRSANEAKKSRQLSGLSVVVSVVALLIVLLKGTI